MPEHFKFDVRVRERLMRKHVVSDKEIEAHVSALPDVAGNATEIELKQPALQTEAERAENSVIVRPATPRPIVVAPIALEDEIEDEEEEKPKAPAARVPAAVAAAAVDEEEDDDDDDDDDDDEDDDDDDDDAEEGQKEKSPPADEGGAGGSE